MRGMVSGWAATLLLGGSAYAVTFSYTFSDPAGQGFNDPTLGAQRRAALEDVGDIWGGLLPSSYAGETINVNASFQSLGGTKTQATLASTLPSGFYTLTGGSVYPDTWYTNALTNHLIGYDANSGTGDIQVQINSDLGSANVLPGYSFYYGTDGNPGANQFDFVSIALHEFAHGLGFVSGYNKNGAFQFFSNPPNAQGYPTVYDQFLTLGDPNQPGSEPIVSMTPSQRASAFVSDDLYWDGPDGIAGNGGDAPKIYAPTTYVTGSSISHTDEDSYPFDLMSPNYSGVDHLPSAMDLGMLKDMGWDVVPEPACLVFFAMAGVGLRRRRRG